MPVVLLVRHAHAGSRGAGPADDSLRPLSVKGFAQARALVPVVSPFAPVVLSSPFTRCIQTVETLAEELGTGVLEAEELGESRPAAAAWERLVAHHDAGAEALLACSHGDVLSELMALLAGRGVLRVAVGGRLPLAKASVWQLEGPDLDHLQGRYLPPPEVDRPR